MLLSVPLATLRGLQWLTWLALTNKVATELDFVPWTVAVNWWLIAVAFVLFITPLGRMGIAVFFARIGLRKILCTAAGL